MFVAPFSKNLVPTFLEYLNNVVIKNCTTKKPLLTQRKLPQGTALTFKKTALNTRQVFRLPSEKQDRLLLVTPHYAALVGKKNCTTK